MRNCVADMRYCTPRGAARSLIVRDDSPGMCICTACAYAWHGHGHGHGMGMAWACARLQMVRVDSPRRACARLTASAAAMARSTTSSGGTHNGSRVAVAAASSGAGGVYLSAEAMRASERLAKTSACHLYSGQMRDPSVTRRRGMMKRSPLSCRARCGASSSAVR